jgi:hypothetical protein
MLKQHQNVQYSTKLLFTGRIEQQQATKKKESSKQFQSNSNPIPSLIDGSHHQKLLSPYLLL